MKRLLTLFALVSLVCHATLPGFAADEPFQSPIVRQLTEATKGETSGVAVLVARDGKVLHQGAFRLADIDHKTPATPQTKFRIGSVTKQFTAAAILRLIEQKKLSLDDKLAQHFPDFSHRPSVTVRQLLTHTSGLHSYTDKPEFLGRISTLIEKIILLTEDVAMLERLPAPRAAKAKTSSRSQAGRKSRR